MNGGSRILCACLVAAFAYGAGCRGQDLNPNTVVTVPPVGHGIVEVLYSSYRPEAFVGRDGVRQRFPGDLQFALGLLRLSYSPLRDFALGVEVPYRWTSYDEPGVEASFASGGWPGIGAFADWSPRQRGRRLQPAVRVEYQRARSETDQILTISDGVSRFAATLQLADGGALPAHWRGAARLRLEYGPPVEASPRHFEARVQLQAGPRLLHVGGTDLHGLAVLGYRASSAARQEGNFLHDRTSQGAFSGLLLSSEFHGRALVRLVSLSALRDIRPRNALSGWRITFSVTSGL